MHLTWKTTEKNNALESDPTEKVDLGHEVGVLLLTYKIGCLANGRVKETLGKSGICRVCVRVKGALWFGGVVWKFAGQQVFLNSLIYKNSFLF